MELRNFIQGGEPVSEGMLLVFMSNGHFGGVYISVTRGSDLLEPGPEAQ
jgi:hypothetical protein